MTEQKIFRGWWVAAALFFTYGLAVGIPYYTVPFFYDYFEKAFGWTRVEVTRGFPLAALFSLAFGPLVIPHFSPRKMIVAGTGCTALALAAWGFMNGSLWMYYAIWFVYIIGYVLSGPIPHQVIVSEWFRRGRGKAMAVVYVSVGILGGTVPKYLASPLTHAFGFRTALIILGAMTFLAWPLAFLVLRDRPAELGLTPDGLPQTTDPLELKPQSYSWLLHQPAFWLLAIGSTASIGAIGSINQHMKFVFKEAGFTNQLQLDAVWTSALMCILYSSILGRIIVGYLADRFSKKAVMTFTYFLVAGSIPLLLLVTPASHWSVYVFAVLFGFGMGADYMLIPMMAADRFGVASLARAMAIILPADTIGQTGFPYVVSLLHDSLGSYSTALYSVIVLSVIGAISIALLPPKKELNAALPLQDAARVAARR